MSKVLFSRILIFSELCFNFFNSIKLLLISNSFQKRYFHGTSIDILIKLKDVYFN